MPAPIVFLDTETTGLRAKAQVWEIAAIRREADGSEAALHLQVAHDTSQIPFLDRRFRIDWATRYDPAIALSVRDAGCDIVDFLAPDGELPVIVGSNPRFDLQMLAPLVAAGCGNEIDIEDLVHYRLVDIGALAYGWFAARASAGAVDDEVHYVLERGLPWSSDELSRALGIDPDDFDRHTAMGDVRWVKAIYDIVTGPSA